MKDVDESVLVLCRQLEGITPQDIKCLKGLVDPRCVDFFKWLKSNMKGNKVIGIQREGYYNETTELQAYEIKTCSPICLYGDLHLNGHLPSRARNRLALCLTFPVVASCPLLALCLILPLLFGHQLLVPRMISGFNCIENGIECVEFFLCKSGARSR
jgi:hypothetical protein